MPLPHYAWICVLLVTSAAAQDTFAELAARATAARNQDDSKNAVRWSLEALRLNPDWKEGLWTAGSLLYEAEQYREAAEPLRRLVALAPTAGPAWALLGLCEYETLDFAAAVPHLDRAISVGVGDQPQMVLVLKFHQAALLTKFGRFDAALEKYSSFVSAQVEDRQVQVGLGLLSLRRALAPVEALETDRDLYSTAGRAFAALLANDSSRARPAYEDLAARYPKSADVHSAYGYFLFGSEPDRAMEQWQIALSLNPSNAAAHAMLAWAYSLRDDREAAMNHARDALAQDADFAVAKIVLGRGLVQSGQVGPGVTHLEEAARLQPANLEAHLALATAYSGLGRKREAERERQLCLTMQAGNAQAFHAASQP